MLALECKIQERINSFFHKRHGTGRTSSSGIKV